ncbi:hypothetical protein KA005_47130 [bacterium]|nr:hypothetical protein [bacterium]
MNAQDFTIYKVGSPTQIVTTDTIDDTGTDNVTLLLKLQQGRAWDLAVQVTAITKTGTVDIDVDYEGSLDGSSWYTITSDSLASGNLTYLYEDDGFHARYLRLTYTGVGTQKTTIDAWAWVMKQ